MLYSDIPLDVRKLSSTFLPPSSSLADLGSLCTAAVKDVHNIHIMVTCAAAVVSNTYFNKSNLVIFTSFAWQLLLEQVLSSWVNLLPFNQLFVICTVFYFFLSPDASVVHASGSGQLQANPHVAGPWLSPGKSTRRAVTTMGSNDLVIGEDHMLGSSCQQYNWRPGRCGSIAFGSSPRRGKLRFQTPAVLRKYPLVKKT